MSACSLLHDALGYNFSINLTYSIDSEFSPESSWVNNHCCDSKMTTFFSHTLAAVMGDFRLEPILDIQEPLTDFHGVLGFKGWDKILMIILIV